MIRRLFVVWNTEPFVVWVETKRHVAKPPMRAFQRAKASHSYQKERPILDVLNVKHHHYTKRAGAAPSQIFPSAPPKGASDVTWGVRTTLVTGTAAYWPHSFISAVKLRSLMSISVSKRPTSLLDAACFSGSIALLTMRNAQPLMVWVETNYHVAVPPPGDVSILRRVTQFETRPLPTYSQIRLNLFPIQPFVASGGFVLMSNSGRAEIQHAVHGWCPRLAVLAREDGRCDCNDKLLQSDALWIITRHVRQKGLTNCYTVGRIKAFPFQNFHHDRALSGYSGDASTITLSRQWRIPRNQNRMLSPVRLDINPLNAQAMRINADDFETTLSSFFS